MSDTPQSEQDLDELVGSLRADGSDINVFFQVFTAKLIDTIPGAVEVEREGGLFKKQHPVRRLLVRLGDDTFEAEPRQGTIACRHTHDVHGVGGGLPFSRDLGFDEWLRALVGALAQQAQTNAAASAALRSLVT
jgi:hypothetical protein